MTSAIDITKPVYGNPTTQSVRDNFDAAYNEITDLQSKTTGAPFLPIAGGIMNGAITLQTDPINPMEVATKRYIDNLAFGQTGGVPEAPNDGFAYARMEVVGGMAWNKTPLFQTVNITRDGAVNDFQMSSGAVNNFIKFNDTTEDYLRFNRTTKNFELVANNVVVQTWNSTATTISNVSVVNGLTVAGSAPTIHLNSPTVGNEYIYFETNNLKRWAIGADSGATGFAIYNYDGVGAIIGKTFNIDPVTGLVTTYNKAQFNNDLNMLGTTAIPTDKWEPWLNVGEVTIRQGRHLAFNTYIGKNASNQAVWKPLVTGYSGSIYQANADGQIYVSVYPSLTAGQEIGTGSVSYSFMANGNLQINNGGLAATGFVNAGGYVTSNSYVQSFSGRVISSSNNPNANPSVAVYSVDGGCAFAMYTNASRTFYFSMANGDGTPAGVIASINQSGDIAAVRHITAPGSAYVTGATVTGSLTVNTTAVISSTLNVAGAVSLGATTVNGALTCGGNDLRCGFLYPAGAINNITNLSGFTIFNSGANGRYYQMEGNCYMAKDPNSADITINDYNSGAIRLANNNGTCYLQNDGQFVINRNGWKPGGGVWADTSDARIKIITGDYTNGLSSIVKLNPRKYKFLGNETLDEIRRPMPKVIERMANRILQLEPQIEYPLRQIESLHELAAEQELEFIGLVAQEVEGYMPEMVTLEPGTIDGEHVDDLRMMDTTALNMAFINAFKEINARLITLENRT
jgi:hypothetical protein